MSTGHCPSSRSRKRPPSTQSCAPRRCPRTLPVAGTEGRAAPAGLVTAAPSSAGTGSRGSAKGQGDMSALTSSPSTNSLSNSQKTRGTATLSPRGVNASPACYPTPVSPRHSPEQRDVLGKPWFRGDILSSPKAFWIQRSPPRHPPDEREVTAASCSCAEGRTGLHAPPRPIDLLLCSVCPTKKASPHTGCLFSINASLVITTRIRIL